MRPLPGDTSGLHSQRYSDRADTGWTEASPMAPPLYCVKMMYPSVANNGNMYFTAFGNDSIPYYLAVSKFENGMYQVPERLSDSINFQSGMVYPAIAPDESYIIFVYDQGTFPECLYISFHKHDGSWSRAKKLKSSINSGIYYNIY